jgi:type I restriction enzyme M protein
MEQMPEEHGGEEGLMADAANDNGKFTRAGVAARLPEIKGDRDFDDERKVLEDYLRHVDQGITFWRWPWMRRGEP